MSQPLLPGEQSSLGRYELLGRLGQGGMGTVYLGRGPDGRRVAIKMVRPEYLDDEEFRGRFRSEVNRAKAVPPFSTAEVIDADPDHEPPYLVVEYVDGPNLAKVLKDHGPLSGAALHSVAVGTATALTGIHGAGVIHRDLKPANVLLALGGIKVIDFGIARAFEATSKHTRTDQMVGTVAYMAPERFDTDDSRPVGPAADIFAWGAVVTYAATGKTPFAADSAPATAMRILTQPPDLDGVPMPLRPLVERTLAKDPRERPTARELLDLLVAGNQPGPVHLPGVERTTERRGVLPGTAKPRPARKRNAVSIGIAAAGVLVLLGAAALLANSAFSSGDTGTPTGAGTQSSADTSAPGALAPDDAQAAILNGDRKTLIHLAEIDRDLAVPDSDEYAVAGDGTGNKSLFALVPYGTSFMLRTLRDPTETTEEERTCLGSDDAGEGQGRLKVGNCFGTDPNVFTLSSTGEQDDQGRPTYVVHNEAGTLHWDDDKKIVQVLELGGAETNLTVSLVDRGALDN